MGLTVRLQDEHGKPRCESDIGVDFHIPTGDVSFRLLCYIDPYGNTVFNQLQMETFLAEWENIRDDAKTQDEVAAWSSVKTFATKCKNDVHLYLRFMGD
jgi:hypothetical protein